MTDMQILLSAIVLLWCVMTLSPLVFLAVALWRMHRRPEPWPPVRIVEVREELPW